LVLLGTISAADTVIPAIVEYLNPNNDTIESIVEQLKIEEKSNLFENGVIRKLYREIDTYITKVSYISNSLLNLIKDVDNLIGNNQPDIVFLGFLPRFPC